MLVVGVEVGGRQVPGFDSCPEVQWQLGVGKCHVRV